MSARRSRRPAERSRSRPGAKSSRTNSMRSATNSEAHLGCARRVESFVRNHRTRSEEVPEVTWTIGLGNVHRLSNIPCSPEAQCPETGRKAKCTDGAKCASRDLQKGYGSDRDYMRRGIFRLRQPGVRAFAWRRPSSTPNPG